MSCFRMLAAIAVAMAGAATAVAPMSAWAQQPVTAFVNVSVVPMDRERVLAGQTVVVRGDRIVAMGPTGKVRVPADAAPIDGRGKFLMPGLTDMHMHVGTTGPERAELVLLLLLANGVTTIRNLDYSNTTHPFLDLLFNSPGIIEGKELLRLRARVTAGELWGPRIYTSGQWYVDSSKSIAQNVEAYRAAGYDLIKVHDELAGPELDSLVAAAHRVGLPIAGHPVGGVAYALQQRFASIEHLLGFPGRDLFEVSLADTLKIPALVAATRQAGVRITPTLSWVEVSAGMKVTPDYYRHYYRGRQYFPPKISNFYSYADRRAALVANNGAMANDTLAAATVRRRLIMALHNAGVELLLGTDSPLIVPGYGVHQELDALVRAGLTPYEALVTGTRNAAASLGVLDSAGTVAVGKRADLVLLHTNPLTDIRHAEQIVGVMAAGRWLSAAEIERRLAEYAKSAVTGSD